MSAKEPASADSDHEPQVSTNAVLILLGDIADTTWRMFIPTILFAIIGYFVDKTLGTNMIFAVTGVIFGAVIAALLVQKQLRKVKK